MVSVWGVITLLLKGELEQQSIWDTGGLGQIMKLLQVHLFFTFFLGHPYL